jgi:hypothetical protein
MIQEFALTKRFIFVWGTQILEEQRLYGFKNNLAVHFIDCCHLITW